ncbi:MAG: hypothetical protein OXE17_06765 [Chloroflexi bacterium]|nr:hypothetical protein [Chloroflexota bacterium]
MSTNSANQTGQQAPPQNSSPARGSRDARRKLLNEAERTADLAAAHHSPGSPEFRQQTHRLRKAAIAWLESALKATQDAENVLRPDPSLRQANKPANPKARPGAMKYRSCLLYWASQYAWDEHDGLGAQESARYLVLTAYLGYRKRVQKEPQQQPAA